MSRECSPCRIQRLRYPVRQSSAAEVQRSNCTIIDNGLERIVSDWVSPVDFDDVARKGMAEVVLIPWNPRKYHVIRLYRIPCTLQEYVRACLRLSTTAAVDIDHSTIAHLS